MSNTIKNHYKEVDPDLLKTTPNPNKHLHELEIPFRGVVNAPSGTGKTNFLVELIERFCAKPKGTFSSIIIVTKNKDEPLYHHLADKGVEIREGLRKIPILEEYDPDVAHLLVFDDLVLSKSLDMVEDYYIRCRKFNVSILFLSQRYFKIPIMIRENCNYLFILKVGSAKNVKLIMAEFSLSVTKEQLMGMYEEATAEKFNVLIIDKDNQDIKRKFRHNLLEFLDPDDF
jgi:hypothetical protein